MLDLSAAALVAAYGRRELSPVEVATPRWRASRRPRQLNAFCRVDGDHARARRARRRHAGRGRPGGLLDGVPVAIKDVFLTRGRPTLRGSLAVDPLGPWEATPPRSPRCGPMARSSSGRRRPGARLEVRNRQPAMASRATRGTATHPGRVERGQRGGARGRHGAARAWHRRRRLDPHPLGFCGVVGLKPTLAACRCGRRARSARRAWRPDGAHGRGRGADARRDRAAGGARRRRRRAAASARRPRRRRGRPAVATARPRHGPGSTRGDACVAAAVAALGELGAHVERATRVRRPRPTLDVLWWPVPRGVVGGLPTRECSTPACARRRGRAGLTAGALARPRWPRDALAPHEQRS